MSSDLLRFFGVPGNISVDVSLKDHVSLFRVVFYISDIQCPFLKNECSSTKKHIKVLLLLCPVVGRLMEVKNGV